MANTKITELTALTQCAATDVLPIVKVSANTTKKVSISDLLRNAPAGTAGAPSIANADDQDTGILFPADNSVGVSTGGTQRLVIDSSGNLGIGSSAPAAKLDVAGNQIFTAANPQIQFNAGGPIIRLPSANTLAFLIDSSNERMRLDSSGNLAVGSTSPQARLEVRQDSSTAYDSSDDSAQRSGTSSICITNHNDSTNSFSQLVFDTAGINQSIARIVAIRTGTSSNDLAFVVEGGNTKREAMRIDSSGNMGIGATAPAAKLDVAGNQLFSAANPQIQFNAGGPIIRLPSANTLAFLSDSTNERMRLDSSGNALLGGTTSPASATKSLAIFNGTAPTGSVANGVVLYAEDVSSSSELKVRDEAGNVTTLSPHNFDLIPEGPSEDMAWSYYSEKDGKRINVDMLKAVRLLEQLTGEQLVFTG